MYDCGSCFAKYLLCGFNFIVFLVGAGVLTIGVWLIVDVNSFIGLTKILPNEDIQNVFQPKLIEHAAYFIIGIGTLMFVLSFLGYCGALRESQWMLTTYGLLLLIILILEIIAGSLAIVYKSKAESETKNVLLMTLDQYRVPAPESGEEMNALTSAWDSLQLGLHCCGVNNFTDYAANSYIVQQNKVMPESCCVIGDDGVVLSQTCTSNPSESNSYYMKGCFQALANWLSTHVNIIIATATGLGAVEILGVFLSFCLAKIFNNPKSR